MKLYFSKGACSLTIRIVAHELGLTLEYEGVDLKAKKTVSGKDYWAINAKGSVPALILEDGKVLTENTAIMQYLAETHPSTLLPTVGHFERYRVLEWLSFMSSDLHKSFGPLFNPNVPQDLKDSLFIPLLKSKLTVLDKALTDRDYFVGEHLTLPDVYCFVVLRWLPGNNIHLSEYPHLQGFFNRVSERSAVRDALKEDLL